MMGSTALRIAHVADGLGRASGGLQFSVAGFCRELAGRGHVIRVFTGDDGSDFDHALYSDVGVELLKRTSSRAWRRIPGLEPALAAFDPDIIFQHGMWLPAFRSVRRFAVKEAIPYVLVPHGMLDPYILSRNPLKKRLARLLYEDGAFRDATAVRVLNQAEAQHVRAVYPASQVVIAPNGATIEPIFETPTKEHDSVLFLGRIDDKKGVLELLEAWKQLEDLNALPQESFLRIVGWGTDENYLQKVADRAKRCRLARFDGPLFGNEKTLAFAKADAFILPSKGEGLPVAVLEAWSQRCVVLMSRECNFLDSEIQAGAVDCGNSIDSIKRALFAFLSLKPQDREKLRDAGVRIIENYSWARSVDAIFSFPPILRSLESKCRI